MPSHQTCQPSPQAPSAVIRTPEPLDPPGAERSWVPRCRQELWKARNTSGPGAYDDQRGVADLVHQGVADLRNLLFSRAGHLPRPAPHPLELESVEVWREVALTARLAVGSRCRADVARRLTGTAVDLVVEQRLIELLTPTGFVGSRSYVGAHHVEGSSTRSEGAVTTSTYRPLPARW